MCMRMFSRESGFTSLIQFGDQGIKTDVPWVVAAQPHFRENCGGFDGQFYAQIATDPLLLTPEIKHALDDPIYRARRIFLSWTAYLLGLGHTPWILQAYAILNILFWFLMLALLIKIICPANLFEWLCILLIVFSTGTLESVRRALTDLPAVYLSLLALYILSKNRAASLGLFTASVLTRETTLLCAPAFLDIKNISSKKFWKQILFLLIPLIVLLAWNFYVLIKFNGHFLERGTSNLDWPLAGHLKNLIYTIQNPSQDINLDKSFAFPAFVGLMIQSAYLLKKPLWKNPYWKYAIGFSLLFFILGIAVTESQRVICRTVLPMTIAFHILLASEKKSASKWWWLILGNIHSPYALINFLTYRI